ncbi:MAG: hypothetical protein A2X18_12770 [Bacteroidetes bacterium GWF2_40_14]|nr:MAG: hypothetical protein A2X18_12770 [Bacteroidetes bacterium GWF2_40_14]
MNIQCPKCGSDQIHADKKGFGFGRGIIGALAGGLLVGTAAGSIGKNNVIITCLSCGHKFKPGEQLDPKTEAVVEKIFYDGYVKPIDKGDMSHKTYKCHYCGKVATDTAKCPKCGCMYYQTDQIN